MRIINTITIAVNLKIYFEKYKKNINEKYKRTENGASGMIFEGYTQRIMSCEIMILALKTKNCNTKKISIKKHRNKIG